MKRIIDYVQETPWNEVAQAMTKDYDWLTERDYFYDKYGKIYEGFKTTKLIDSNKFIYLELVKEDEEDEESWFTDISMSVDGVTDSRIGIDFVEWGECLSLQVNPIILDTYTVSEVLGHFLFEITFYGATNEEVQAKYKKICDDVDAIRSGEMETTPWEDLDFNDDGEL